MHARASAGPFILRNAAGGSQQACTQPHDPPICWQQHASVSVSAPVAKGRATSQPLTPRCDSTTSGGVSRPGSVRRRPQAASETDEETQRQAQRRTVHCAAPAGSPQRLGHAMLASRLHEASRFTPTRRITTMATTHNQCAARCHDAVEFIRRPALNPAGTKAMPSQWAQGPDGYTSQAK